ncbi:MAG: class II glutamine amidotransferase [Labilithrix sp.]|nr:class II glutamine amidotransferase [Labilithrix sp.]MCW5834967.1 class II glutamine amidotransferase [Labilithrix sp.]
MTRAIMRVLGIISTDALPFERSLFSAPRSLASLSSVQPDGWGAAVYDRATRDWSVERHALGATGEESFASLAPRLRGNVLVAHVRSRSASPVVSAHPFRRGRWVFAHDGTLGDRARLRSAISRERARECEGDTGSELLFAHLLSRLDDAGVTGGGPTADVDAALRDATADLVERRAGTGNLLLSDGEALYAHCLDGALHLVERAGRGRSLALVVASEPLTDEPWLRLAEGSLLRCGGAGGLELALLRGADPRVPPKSERELPFTD